MFLVVIKIFIGYDKNEVIAYHVCVNSLIRHSSELLSITPLAENNLPYYKETHTDGSNSFIYRRFLVPELMNYKGWALYIDGDMIVREDIVKLWNLRDNSKAVVCVHHNYKTKKKKKYFKNKNENYPRKNWSSVILWNCAHSANKILTSNYISRNSGSTLHRFKWLKDELIGELPINWNWLPDEFGENYNASLVHYTLGLPCFKDHANTPMASEWHKERLFTEYFKK